MRRAAWALLFLCACPDDGPLTPGASQLRVEPLRIDFGPVFVGRSESRTLTFEAQGGVPLEFRARFGGGAGEGLSAFPAAGRIPAGASASFTVRFEPSVLGQRRTELFVQGETETATVTILGEGRFIPDCEDGNICTADRFDFELGRCISEASVEDCDDFDACTLQDQCAGGVCLGQGRSCDDGNVCTDDFCDARSGCVNVLAEACDDGNPCTEDLCDPQSGCTHRDLPDFTACGTCRACRNGRCELGEIAEGRMCDDGDVCTDGETCTSGECLLEDFPYPADGELQWEARVGPLAPGATDNPVVDVDGTTFVGVADGVVAVGPCGELVWERRDLGPPRAGSMLISPLGLSVPFEDRIVDLDRVNGGATLSSFVLDAITGVDTASTSVAIQDMSIRSSGALLLSLWLDRPGVEADEGILASVGAQRRGAHLVARLGGRFARRLVVDLDEAPVVLLRAGPPGAPAPNPVEEQVVRLGLLDVPETRWSSEAATLAPGELSIDANSRVLWSAALLGVTRDGFPRPLGPEATAPRGALITDRDRLSFIDTEPGLGSTLVGLNAQTGADLYRVPLPGWAEGHSPASDAAGNVYAATSDGWLIGIDREGEPLFELELGYLENDPISVTINPEHLIIVVAGETVFGVESGPGLNTSAWPRRRRDNFGTARR
jgi:outer membrane protein assembly factor BamB